MATRSVVTGAPPRDMNGRIPLWLRRAMRHSAKTENNETVRTETAEVDGQTILYPTIRADFKTIGAPLYRPDDPLQVALDRRDYIIVPEGTDPRAMSRRISRMIGQRRKERGI